METSSNVKEGTALLAKGVGLAGWLDQVQGRVFELKCRSRQHTLVTFTCAGLLNDTKNTGMEEHGVTRLGNTHLDCERPCLLHHDIVCLGQGVAKEEPKLRN